MYCVLDFVASHPVLTGFVLFVGPIIGWEIWQGILRPRLMGRAVLNRLVDEMLTKHGERAEDMAFTMEHRAWYDSDTFEQGKWRRVRKELQRRRK